MDDIVLTDCAPLACFLDSKLRSILNQIIIAIDFFFEEELPETDKYILLSFSNFSIPCVGRYEEDENGGEFYVGDDDESCVSQDMFVNAWTNLPDPYQPKGE